MQKYIILIFLSVIFLNLIAVEQQAELSDIYYTEDQEYDYLNPPIKPGEVLVKFKDEVDLQISNNRGMIETGISSLDVLYENWQVNDMIKVFSADRGSTSFRLFSSKR